MRGWKGVLGDIRQNVVEAFVLVRQVVLGNGLWWCRSQQAEWMTVPLWASRSMWRRRSEVRTCSGEVMEGFRANFRLSSMGYVCVSDGMLIVISHIVGDSRCVSCLRIFDLWTASQQVDG